MLGAVDVQHPRPLTGFGRYLTSCGVGSIRSGGIGRVGCGCAPVPDGIAGSQ